MQHFNQSTEMAVFVQVVESGGFSAAARKLDLTPSGVSKLISRLENRLGVRLINRNTRQIQLTPEGSAFFDRCLRILDDISLAEREAMLGVAPRGRVRINSHVPFGKHFLLPRISERTLKLPWISCCATMWWTCWKIALI